MSAKTGYETGAVVCHSKLDYHISIIAASQGVGSIMVRAGPSLSRSGSHVLMDPGSILPRASHFLFNLPA